MKLEIKIEFCSEEDLQYFVKFFRKCKESSGTVGGLWAGLGCSALRTATIYDGETDSEIKIKN